MVAVRAVADAVVNVVCPVTEILVAVALVMTALVVVELVTIRSVILASVATRDEMKELVVDELVVAKLVTELEADVKFPVTVRSVVVALVNVASVAVSVEMSAVAAERREEKKVEEVALVKAASVAKRLVAVALVMLPFVP